MYDLVPSARAKRTAKPPEPAPVTASRRELVVRLTAGALVVTAVLVALGLLLVHAFDHSGLVTWDGSVDRWLADHRTRTLNTLTVFGSGLSNTQTAIAVAFVAFFALRWWLGRWYESWVVTLAITGELLIFLVVTAAVHRPRPAVPPLDVAPPTSSFPSGHTGAAVALFGCLAVILVRYMHHRTTAFVLAALLWLAPAVVGVSRLYRGMHFPTDVIAGALGGGLWLVWVLMTTMPRSSYERQKRPLHRIRRDRPSGS